MEEGAGHSWQRQLSPIILGGNLKLKSVPSLVGPTLLLTALQLFSRRILKAIHMIMQP